jgi:hypothetical protein
VGVGAFLRQGRMRIQQVQRGKEFMFFKCE